MIESIMFVDKDVRIYYGRLISGQEPPYKKVKITYKGKSKEIAHRDYYEILSFRDEFLRFNVEFVK